MRTRRPVGKVMSFPWRDRVVRWERGEISMAQSRRSVRLACWFANLEKFGISSQIEHLL